MLNLIVVMCNCDLLEIVWKTREVRTRAIIVVVCVILFEDREM